jgi:hypothetical protein
MTSTSTSDDKFSAPHPLLLSTANTALFYCVRKLVTTSSGGKVRFRLSVRTRTEPNWTGSSGSRFGKFLNLNRSSGSGFRPKYFLLNWTEPRTEILPKYHVSEWFQSSWGAFQWPWPHKFDGITWYNHFRVDIGYNSCWVLYITCLIETRP